MINVYISSADMDVTLSAFDKKMVCVDEIEDADYVFIQQKNDMFTSEQFKTLVKARELEKNIFVFSHKKEIENIINENILNTRQRMDMEME